MAEIKQCATCKLENSNFCTLCKKQDTQTFYRPKAQLKEENPLSDMLTKITAILEAEEQNDPIKKLTIMLPAKDASEETQLELLILNCITILNVFREMLEKFPYFKKIIKETLNLKDNK